MISAALMQGTAMAPGPLWDTPLTTRAVRCGWLRTSPEVAAADVALPAVALSLCLHTSAVVLVCGCACPAVARSVSSCVRLLCRLLAVSLPPQLCCAGSGCCAQSAGAFLDYSPII